MFDQADKLRQLVRETIKESAALAPGVPLIAVSGAREGVGTSTVALRLAQELAQLGKQVVLVDAHIMRPTLGTMFGMTTHAGIADVLNGSRSAVEVLQSLSSGISLLPGVKSPGIAPEMNIRSLRRLLIELRTLHSVTDLVVLDAGAGFSPWIERMWTAALQILLVTTPDATTVREAYSTVKSAPWGDVDGKLRLVVNRCNDNSLAKRVSDGFTSTCRQFLGMKLVGSAAQVAAEQDVTFRQSVRLLAADVLSQSFVFGRRLPGVNVSGVNMPGVNGAPYAASSQAAGLLCEPTTSHGGTSS